MKKTIVIATTNTGKLKEIKEILPEFNIVSLSDMGIDIDVVEDSETFISNAVKKATEICAVCNEITLADDSGLEIDFLDKKPGVYSARFLGEDTPYSIKNAHILSLLPQDMSQRTARFVCAICVAVPNNGEIETITAQETFEGVIAYEPKGDNGFGYDPIFYVPEYNMTSAEMPPELKNKLSHRGKAIKKIRDYLL